MRLLFITQVVDKNDGVLGFVHGWLVELSKVFESIEVICLKKGTVELPPNIAVHSLGKEEGISRAKYVRRFFSFAIGLRKKYDNVFVHMNPEYIILMGVLWRLMGKRIVLWYNHTYGTWRTKAAMRLAHVVCHTSPYAYTAGTKKSLQMPAGIDTRVFNPDPSIARIPNSILYLGRIAPVKGVHLLVAAAKLLVVHGVDFKLNIYGAALPRDAEYFDALRRDAGDTLLAGKVELHGGIPHEEAVRVFREHEVFVNLTPAGNYDKTVLEAMACGGISVVSSKAFADILTEGFRFEENNADDLARALERNLARSAQEQKQIGETFSKYVHDTHDLQLLAQQIRGLYGN